MGSFLRNVVGKVFRNVGFGKIFNGGLTMSKKIFAGLLVVGLLVSPAMVMAATEGPVKLTVQVTGTADIEVWYLDPATQPGTYDFGSLGAGATSISVASVTVKNTSTTLIEDWSIRASDARGTVDWTLATTADADQYVLWGLLNGDSQPADSDFDGDGDDNLTTTSTAMSTINYAKSGGENGVSVGTGETRGLWFKIQTPTSVSDTSAHTIFVTIVAQQAG